MTSKIELSHWNSIKNDLQVRYPHLTQSDLLWRGGTKDDLLKEIATKLKITWKELDEIVESL